LQVRIIIPACSEYLRENNLQAKDSITFEKISLKKRVQALSEEEDNNLHSNLKSMMLLM
jgi:hypothetical protein